MAEAETADDLETETLTLAQRIRMTGTTSG
jgi:hypothetical protein